MSTTASDREEQRRVFRDVVTDQEQSISWFEARCHQTAGQPRCQRRQLFERQALTVYHVDLDAQHNTVTTQEAQLSQRSRVCLVRVESTTPRAHSLINSYFGFRFSTACNYIMFCCLRRNVETCCHKHFGVRLSPTTNDADECHQLATVRHSCVYNTWRSDR